MEFGSSELHETWLIASIVCVLFVFIILQIFLGWGSDWDRSLLHQLSETTAARGLITLLIAVATVGIALTLTIYVVATDDANAKDKFALGKEILTALIGVLGTIVGIYFGADQNKAQTDSHLFLSAVTLDRSTHKIGETLVVTANVAGGQPPFKYT